MTVEAYFAKNKDNSVWMFLSKPWRGNGKWKSRGDSCKVYSHDLVFIQCSDKERLNDLEWKSNPIKLYLRFDIIGSFDQKEDRKSVV